MEYLQEITSLKDQILTEAEVKVPRGIDNVVIAGMGGSGIAGRIFQEFYGARPVTLVNSYEIPNFVDSRTFFIAISYSGNTEETLRASEEAIRKGAKVAAISSGGKLAGLVKDTVLVPGNFQPRSVVGYLTLPLLRGFGLIKYSDIQKTRKLLENIDLHTKPLERFAKELSEERKIPVIFGVPYLNSVAYRWKTQFNENSKVMAYSASFPELNHNDTMALEKTYRKDELYFFVLTSRLSSKKIKSRIKITAEICGINIREIEGEGSSLFSNVFTLIHKGDYISYFLARERGVDPRDVSVIEKLKNELRAA
jgi:glucose/mannose-6-phosphate isomerase